MTGGATAAVVSAVRGVAFSDLPPEAVAVAKCCVLDWLGCALAGSAEPLAAMVAEEVLAEGGTPEATLVGRAEMAPASGAALANGAASHALDFDDTHLAMMGHPTAPVAPAALALGERLGSSGADVLAAVVAGVEAECRVGLLVSPSHYARGFHATATLGAFGSAAACAVLLDLDEAAFLHALGIAGTQAAGLKAVFGTMCKPLHAGTAARNGLLAARLAARGFTSSPAVLEAPQGFGATHADALAGTDALDAAAARFLVTRTLFKYHAACYLTHAAIEAALSLRDDEGVKPADLVAAEVRVHPTCVGVCDIAEPATGLEGKFSLRATVAMALLGDDTADPAAYADARMADPELVALRDRIAVVPTAGLATTEAVLAVRAADGLEVEARADTGVPAADVAQQWRRLAAKFAGLAAPVVGRGRAAEVVDAVDGLEHSSSVGELLALCRK